METSLAPRRKLKKVGLQLYTAAGPEIVRAVRAEGGRIFLDLKLHDIPNTVAMALKSLMRKVSGPPLKRL